MTKAHALSTQSRTENLWWLLTPAAALFYPQAVGALYQSGKLLHRANGPGGGLAWVILVLSAAIFYGVPALGIGVAYQSGRHEKHSASELLAPRLAHLTVASPSLFVLIGVIFYLLHSANGDSVFWSFLWLTILGTGASAIVRRSAVTPVSSMPNPIPLRVAHGISALLIVLIFLAARGRSYRVRCERTWGRRSQCPTGVASRPSAFDM